MRLNLFRVHDASHDHPTKHKNSISEQKSFEYQIKIEGMMCPHCEATVSKALEAVDGVVSAQASHEQGVAFVQTSRLIDPQLLREAVEHEDYSVLEINEK